MNRLSRIPASARWGVVLLVVVVALIVAIWPRGGGDTVLDSGGSAQTAGPIPGATASVTPADLDEARSRAGLAPCPTATGPAPASSALRGVTVPCLGAPGDVDLGAATAGQPLLINFWAPWCLPCRRELPTVEAFANRARAAVDVLAVQAKEGSENPVLALGLLTEIGVRLPSVVDSQSRIAAALGIPRVYPVSVLVRADGTVAKVLPTVFTDEQSVADAVDRYLGVRV
ncbi:TlpA family protein disulfide reductase [Williamsia deligens]|uniref:TlpA family protein disulfide reductase n=1 Tax=Williamsia deligens TaxID=321325 RepID=A0ABW3G633_9NOCA|nr:redoxin family protein [Williamsia deligens]MCP2193290.1 Thiol-disulfide isomerase or thioredoxin [Williamsia deligens]